MFEYWRKFKSVFRLCARKTKYGVQKDIYPVNTSRGREQLDNAVMFLDVYIRSSF
jgi:hypothetical protein